MIPTSKLGRIAVIYPYHWTLPNLQDIAQILVEHNYYVDIYTLYDESFPLPNFNDRSMSVNINHPALLGGAAIRWPKWCTGRRGIFCRWFISKICRLSLIRKMKILHEALPYVCVIGMDPKGLEDANFIAESLSVPLVYWSLELYFRDECLNRIDNLQKEKERKISQKTTFVVSQDHWRAEALSIENGLDSRKMFLVPNAKRCKASRSPNDYLRHRFNIPSERKIVLSVGWPSWWSMYREIISAAVSWPNEYVLVWQCRKRVEKASMEGMTDYSNIIFSYEPASDERYRDIVDSADVGLAFYSSDCPGSIRCKNHEIMGLSSGKLADYLQSGLPVITNKLIGTEQIIASYDCGISVDGPHDIRDALHTIFANYQRYSENACKCFNEQWELEKHLLPVIDQINSIKA